MSSQYLTSLLLASPLFENGLQLSVSGTQISRSYIDMTFSSLSQFGVQATNENYSCYRVDKSAPLQARNVEIESDASGASYFFALAALGDREILVGNLSSSSTQGDAQFPQLLKRMGCSIREIQDEQGDWIGVKSEGSLRALEVDMQLMPDSAQTLAVLCACAQGTSTLRGLSTLKVKETDRLLALQTELKKCGISSDIGSDSICVHGGTPRPARISTYEDHRMAMCFAPLALRTGTLEIEEPSVVTKSFPEFWTMLRNTGLINLHESTE